MDYSALESAIVARLIAKVPAGVTVMALPEADPSVAYPQGAAGKITVAYQGSEFFDSEDTGVVLQPEKIAFEVVVQSRKLRGTSGIYPVLASVKKALLGWQTPTTAKIQFSRAKFVSHESGVWTYDLTLTTMNVATEEPDDQDLVIATKLTAATTNYEDIVVESQTQSQ